MTSNISIPEAIASRRNYKRKFSFGELYRALVYVPGAISTLSKNKKAKLVSPEFIERIQLAITEVNGCPACSYHHTKMALQQGMSNEEISSFLSGGNEFIKSEEAKAILFAQHFADARGFPEKYTFDALVEEYGKPKAAILLSAAQVMLVGNIYGLPFSAFQARLKGQAYTDSSLFYELAMLVGGIIIMPFALLHGIIKSVMRIPNKRLDTNIEPKERVLQPS